MEEERLPEDNRVIKAIEDLKPLLEVIAEWISRDNGVSRISKLGNALYDEVSRYEPQEVKLKDILQLIRDPKTLEGIYFFLLLMRRIGEELDKEVQNS